MSKQLIENACCVKNDWTFDKSDHAMTMLRIKKSVKQGDALSCTLFIICLDPVLRNFERDNLIKPLNNVTPLSNRLVKKKTGAYADDVGKVIMNIGVSINDVFKEYMRFSECSGIRLNEMKSEVMKLKSETVDYASKQGTSE